MKTDDYNRAVDKVRDEMAKEDKRPEIGAVGELMTAMLQDQPDIAGAILAKGKTLTGAFDALKAHASKHKAGQCYAMTDAEARKLLRDYYGINGEAPRPSQAAPAPTPPQPQTPAQDLFDLDALLQDLTGAAGRELEGSQYDH